MIAYFAVDKRKTIAKVTGDVDVRAVRRCLLHMRCFCPFWVMLRVVVCHSRLVSAWVYFHAAPIEHLFEFGTVDGLKPVKGFLCQVAQHAWLATMSGKVRRRPVWLSALEVVTHARNVDGKRRLSCPVIYEYHELLFIGCICNDVLREYATIECVNCFVEQLSRTVVVDGVRRIGSAGYYVTIDGQKPIKHSARVWVK